MCLVYSLYSKFAFLSVFFSLFFSFSLVLCRARPHFFFFSCERCCAAAASTNHKSDFLAIKKQKKQRATAAMIMCAPKVNPQCAFSPLFFPLCVADSPLWRERKRGPSEKRQTRWPGFFVFPFRPLFTGRLFWLVFLADEKKSGPARQQSRPLFFFGRAPKGHRARARSPTRAHCAPFSPSCRPALFGFCFWAPFQDEKKNKKGFVNRKKKRRKWRVQSRVSWRRPTLRDATKAAEHTRKAAHASPPASIRRAQAIPFFSVSCRDLTALLSFFFSAHYLLGRARANPHARSPNKGKP